jgi:hypothetical protein
MKLTPRHIDPVALIFLLVFVFLLIYPSLYIPTDQPSLSLLEEMRKKTLQDMLILMMSDEQTQEKIKQYELRGLSLNEAVASVIVDENLISMTPIANEISVCQRNEAGRWELLDVFGKPYTFMRRNENIVLLTVNNK